MTIRLEVLVGGLYREYARTSNSLFASFLNIAGHISSCPFLSFRKPLCACFFSGRWLSAERSCRSVSFHHTVEQHHQRQLTNMNETEKKKKHNYDRWQAEIWCLAMRATVNTGNCLLCVRFFSSPTSRSTRWNYCALPSAAHCVCTACYTINDTMGFPTNAKY